jgi:HTH-type transcriptional regulator / antitoxin HipB
MPTTLIQTPKDIGSAVRKRRQRDQLTLKDVAGLTGVGIRFLSELENGKTTVRFDKLLHVVQALGLRLQVLDPSHDDQDPTP